MRQWVDGEGKTVGGGGEESTILFCKRRREGSPIGGGGLAHDCPRRQGQKDWQNREENSLWIDWACGGGLGIASSTVSAAMRELWLRRTFGFSEAFAGLRAAFPRLGRYRYRCYSIGETTEIIPRYQS